MWICTMSHLAYVYTNIHIDTDMYVCSYLFIKHRCCLVRSFALSPDAPNIYIFSHWLTALPTTSVSTPADTQLWFEARLAHARTPIITVHISYDKRVARTPIGWRYVWAEICFIPAANHNCSYEIITDGHWSHWWHSASPNGRLSDRYYHRRRRRLVAASPLCTSRHTRASESHSYNIVYSGIGRAAVAGVRGPSFHNIRGCRVRRTMRTWTRIARGNTESRTGEWVRDMVQSDRGVNTYITRGSSREISYIHSLTFSILWQRESSTRRREMMQYLKHYRHICRYSVVRQNALVLVETGVSRCLAVWLRH